MGYLHGPITYRIDDKTSEQIRAQIKRLAEKAFAEHALRDESLWSAEGEGRWYCGKPGTGIHHFRVIVYAGHILILGDLGSQVFRVGSDALAWLLGSLDSLDYFLSKAEHPQRTFFVKDALADIAERIREAEEGKERQRYQKAAAEFKERLGWGEQPEIAWGEVWWRVLGDCEAPSCTDWDSQLLWQYHALRCFRSLYRRQREIDAIGRTVRSLGG